MLVLISIGIVSKNYHGAGANWLNNSLGGIIYVIFFACFFSLFYRFSHTVIIGVFIVSCLIELSQLYKPLWLVTIRTSFVGRYLLGNTYSATDFIYYASGAILAFPLLRKLKK